MAMCLMHGIIDRDYPGEVPDGADRDEFLIVENIAKYYFQWLSSPPFDIGLSIKTAFEPLWEVCKPAASVHQAAIFNKDSVTNGALTRCTPMAIFTSSLWP